MIFLLVSGLIFYVLALISFTRLQYDLGFGLLIIASIQLIVWSVIMIIRKIKEKGQ